MTPFAWATSQSAPANAEEPVAPAQVPAYVLPFDGHRPVLICGHTFSGKEAFVNHLLAGHKDSKPVQVINPTGRSGFDFGSRPSAVLSPEDLDDDAAFFVRATEMVHEATSVEGGALVVDEFLFLTESYQNALPEQEAFTYVLDEALTAARRNRARVLMVSSRIPVKAEMARFGCRFFIGPILPMDWVMMFGRDAAAVETANRPGTGVLYLDRNFQAIEFPLTVPQRQAAAPAKSKWGRKPSKPSKPSAETAGAPQSSTSAGESAAAHERPAKPSLFRRTKKTGPTSTTGPASPADERPV